jgi:hypothetical protein
MLSGTKNVRAAASINQSREKRAVFASNTSEPTTRDLLFPFPAGASPEAASGIELPEVLRTALHAVDALGCFAATESTYLGAQVPGGLPAPMPVINPSSLSEANRRPVDAPASLSPRATARYTGVSSTYDPSQTDRYLGASASARVEDTEFWVQERRKMQEFAANSAQASLRGVNPLLGPAEGAAVVEGASPFVEALSPEDWLVLTSAFSLGAASRGGAGQSSAAGAPKAAADESLLWVPTEVVLALATFRQCYPAITDVDARALLFQLNRAYAARLKSVTRRLYSTYAGHVETLHRRHDLSLPYKEVMQASTIARLYKELGRIKQIYGGSAAGPDLASGSAAGIVGIAPAALSPGFRGPSTGPAAKMQRALSQLGLASLSTRPPQRTPGAPGSPPASPGLLVVSSTGLHQLPRPSPMVGAPGPTHADNATAAVVGQLLSVPGSGAKRLDAAETQRLVEQALSLAEEMSARARKAMDENARLRQENAELAAVESKSGPASVFATRSLSFRSPAVGSKGAHRVAGHTAAKPSALLHS